MIGALASGAGGGNQLLDIRPRDDGDGGPGPGLGCWAFHSDSLASLRRRCEEQEQRPRQPSCLDLVRAARGLQPDMHLRPLVREAVLAALETRCSPQPAGLQAQLRPYQLEGFRWLVANAENGIGCILADDMGLGKTVQTVALLLHMKAAGRLDLRPALIVSPFSVMSCWEREVASKAPQLQRHVYHGPDRALEEGAFDAPGVDVVLTTYQMLQRDQERLCAPGAPRFACIVLDEAQAIKNAGSLTTLAAKEVARASGGECARIALSGTPIENKLREFYSILDFLNPGQIIVVIIL